MKDNKQNFDELLDLQSSVLSASAKPIVQGLALGFGNVRHAW